MIDAALAERRADKRRYAKLLDGKRVLIVRFDGHDGHIVRWTGSCSGCDESGERGTMGGRGSGCSECGYTGKRRREEWVPLAGAAYEGDCIKEAIEDRESKRVAGLKAEHLPAEFCRDGAVNFSQGDALRVLDEGHCYDLAPLDSHRHIGGLWHQRLQFVKREGAGYPGNVGRNPGTTSQEVLRALINRACYVNGQIPCWQTRLSIYLMGAVVWLYEHRAARRHGRPAPGLHDSVYGVTCYSCGHVQCGGFCKKGSR